MLYRSVDIIIVVVIIVVVVVVVFIITIIIIICYKLLFRFLGFFLFAFNNNVMLINMVYIYNAPNHALSTNNITL